VYSTSSTFVYQSFDHDTYLTMKCVDCQQRNERKKHTPINIFDYKQSPKSDNLYLMNKFYLTFSYNLIKYLKQTTTKIILLTTEILFPRFFSFFFSVPIQKNKTKQKFLICK
jgi:hypothetical protein